MRARVLRCIAASLLALTLAPIAQAQETEDVPKPIPPRPAQQLSYTNLFAARLNPVGLSDIFHAVYKFKLYDSDSLAFENNYVGPTFEAMVSPAFAKLGLGIEVQPASFIRLYARYEWYPHFGTFDRLLAFPGPQGDYSDDAVEQAGDQGDNISLNDAGLFTAGSLVQLKFGPIAVRSQTLFMLSQFNLPEGDRVWLENTYDVLPASDGWFVHNDTDALYLTDFGLIAGVRYSITQALYSQELLDETNAGEDPNPTNQRLGLLLAYRFFNDPAGAAFNNPTLLTIVNWYLSHRYRAGQEVNQAIPYFVLAFAFSGDLYTLP